MENYKNMTDEQLIQNLRDGDNDIIDYLMEKYKNLVRKEANAVFMLGGDNDDLIQEGMIGLFKAVQSYRFDQNASFYSFAKLCITRQIYSAIEASKRKKHVPLNSYVSLNEKESETGGFLDIIEVNAQSNPEEILVSNEYVKFITGRLKEELSEFENQVLDLHLEGTDYRTIADLLDRSPKTVDNALQRIKAKTHKIIEKAQ